MNSNLNLNEESSAKVIESIGMDNKVYLSHYIKDISNTTEAIEILNMEGAEEMRNSKGGIRNMIRRMDK